MSSTIDGNNLLSGLTPTLNKMGYMFDDLTAYGKEFILFSQQSGGPVLEIAAAYGKATLKVLQSNIKVVANDLDPRHLEVLVSRVPDNQKSLLDLSPGRFPTETSFQPNHFQAILLANVLHFLNGDEISLGIRKLFAWLKPGGKVYVIAASPYVRMWSEFIPIFEKNRSLKMKWPGYLEDMSIFKSNDRLEQLPGFMHFFHPDELGQAFQEAGFIIEKSEFFSQPTWPHDMQLDGRESVGIIAKKPL